MIKRCLAFFMFLMFFVCAYAQVSLTASVDHTQVDVTQDINLTLTLQSNSANTQVPVMPSLPNFNIYSSGQSTSISMLNGKVNAIHNFNYILSPRFPGRSIIEPFTVEIGGKTYSTEPIEIEVVRGDGRKPQGDSSSKRARNSAMPISNENSSKPDFFMTAEVDKKQAYLDEQINLIIRFYQSKNAVGNPQYERPKMQGLVFEETRTNQEFVYIDGKQYVYTEFPSVVFGIVPGKGTISPATVYYVAQGSDPFDIFFGGTGAGGGSSEVKTDPLQIEIKPLPEEGKTKTFYGAVGSNYKIEAKLEQPQTIHAGEPVTLIVDVSGRGNIKGIGNVPVPDMGSSFRVYDTASSVKTQIKDDIMEGAKTFKTLIVPRVSGSYEIPAIKFTYFDTGSYTYKTVSSKPIMFHVEPASQSGQASGVAFTEEAQRNADGGVEKLTQDINYIKSGKPSAFTSVLSFIDSLGAWNWLIAVLIIFGILYNIFSREDISILGKKRAYIKAKSALGKAKTVAEVSAVLKDYIEEKQRAPIGILTIAEVSSKLKLDGRTAQDLADLWQEFEMLKYAPSASLKDSIAVTEAANRTLEIIKRLEKEIK